MNGPGPDRELRVHVPGPPLRGHLELGEPESAPDRIEVTGRWLERGGRPWIPVTGEIHYSRLPRERWRDVLGHARAGGLDSVATYVFWRVHEPEPGRFAWSGDRDLRAFVELAADHGLDVVVRLGPWAHGECRYGGFPDWLVERGLRTRTNDPDYLGLVRRFYAAAIARLRGLTHAEGGPVIAAQVENELHDQPDHLAELRRIAEDLGLRVPIWTATGWGGARLPETLLPVYSAYSDGFWEDETCEQPAFAPLHFGYRQVRDDLTVGADLRRVFDGAAPDAAEPTGSEERWPFATCELGGGMHVAYHRRPLVSPEDVAALALAKIGSGSVWQGYYMYSGGTQRTGPQGTEQESHATGYPNDVPRLTYDFGAPVGEHGQIRAHHHYLRRQHLWLRQEGHRIAAMSTTVGGGPAEPRWAVRSDGRSGYLFTTTHLPGQRPPAAQTGVRFTVHFDDETVTVPTEPIDIPAGRSLVWPLRYALTADLELRSATAQLLTRISDEEGDLVVLAAADGVPVEIVLGDGASVDLPAPPGPDCLVRLDGVRLLVLDEDSANRLYRLPVAGRDRLVLSDAPVTAADGDLLVHPEAAHATVAIHPAPAALAAEGAQARPGSAGGLWTAWTLTARDAGPIPVPVEARPGPAAAPEPRRGGPMRRLSAPVDYTGAATVHIDVPDWGRADRALLRIEWTGDVGRAYIGEEFVSDHFWHGRAWDIDLSGRREAVAEHGVRLELLPWREETGVWVDPSVRGIEDGVTIESATLVRVGRVRLGLTGERRPDAGDYYSALRIDRSIAAGFYSAPNAPGSPYFSQRIRSRPDRDVRGGLRWRQEAGMVTDPSGAPRAVPPIPQFAVAPYLLLRINPVAWDGPGEAEEDSERFGRIRALAAAQRQSAEKLTDLLYDIAGGCEKDVRNAVVLPLRRAIHNERLPRRLDRADIRAVVSEPSVETWLDNQELLEDLRAELVAAHSERLARDRDSLRALLGDQELRRSLSVSSELLPDAADKYRAAPWEQVKKNTRKSEESLLRYAMRARTKTSPFSRYTVAGFLPDSPAGPGAGIGPVTSQMEFNRALLRRIEARLSRLPAVRGGMRFHPSAGLRLEGGRFIAVGSQERLGPEAAEISARYGEAKITVPANAASVALVEWLRSRTRPSATFEELTGFITERVPGAGVEAAAGFVEKLCDYGVLAPEPIVDDHTPDALAELARLLADVDDPAVAAVREELDRAGEAMARFATAGPAERVVQLRTGKAACNAALTALGDPEPAPEPIWFEDAVVEPTCSSIDDWGPVLEDCRRLLDFLQIFDEQHVFSRVLNHRFTGRYGPGGVCESLDELGELYLPAYDDALQITEGFDHELIEADPVLKDLIPLRARVVDELAERLLRPRPGDDPASPLDIEPVLESISLERCPAWLTESPASHGVFMQPLGGNPPTGAVLNKIYNGWGNYVSRFLTHADRRVLDRVRRMVAEHLPAGVSAELRPVQGFNANLHPLLTETELDWDGTGDAAMLPLDRLQVRHDPARDRVFLSDPADGARVHPLYLGFLIPYFLPSRLVPLTAMGGSGSIFFEPQVSADRSPSVDRGHVRRYRALRFRSIVLARARWHVPSGMFPRPEPGESEPDYFVRLGEWRTELGIPDHVFVHPPAPEMSPGNVNDYFGAYMDNRKPQYVDLLSRLHVRHLDRLLAHQPGTDIVVEEALPGPAGHFPVDGQGHAAEVVAEFYRKARQ